MSVFTRAGKLELLPLNDLVKSSEIDQAAWNYEFIIGKISHQRFKILLSLLGNSEVDNLLSIGYGSGIFFPELRKHVKNLYGIDVHNKNNEVMEKLAKYGIASNLIQCDAADIPLSDKLFDVCIAISSMEFVDNIDLACQEVLRILKDNGKFIVVTPTTSSIADMGLKILTGRSAETDYNGRRKNLIPTLMKYFKVEKELTFPRISALKLYTGLKLIKK